MRIFTEDQFLRLGFEAMRDSTWSRSSRRSQISNFRSNYGTSPKVLSLIWYDLQEKLDLTDRITYDTLPLHLLVTYRWFTTYDSEPILKSTFELPVKEIRRWCRDISAKVALLRKVKIDPYWLDDGGLLIGKSLDGIHYRITEPRPFSTRYKSHKSNGPGLSYEYCINTHDNRICWLRGPFPAGTPDLTMFKESGLMEAIKDLQAARREVIKVIADDGYFTQECIGILSYRNELDPREIAWFKDRSLSRHETFNGRTKRFNCLTASFHHDRSSDNSAHEHPRHKACVESICVTIQYELEIGETTLLDPYPS